MIHCDLEDLVSVSCSSHSCISFCDLSASDVLLAVVSSAGLNPFWKGHVAAALVSLFVVYVSVCYMFGVVCLVPCWTLCCSYIPSDGQLIAMLSCELTCIAEPIDFSIYKNIIDKLHICILIIECRSPKL